MKLLRRLTISIATSGVLVLGMWTLPVLGQGQTAMEQKANTSKEKTLTGCLAGPNAEGNYTLTNKQHKNGIEVSSAEGLDLKEHAGHEVKLAGMWTSGGAAIGEKEKAGAKRERHFKATKVEHIASTCNATSEKTQ
jgi:hypothetical protein